MSEAPLSPSRQVIFHQMLVAARKTVLMEALSETLGQIDPSLLKEQISRFVPEDAQRILAAAGVRDEHVFPVPAVFVRQPSLVGYYRLLLGFSQKQFYRRATGMGIFKTMESRGLVSRKADADVELFCTVMGRHLSELVRQISPRVSSRDISELPLLTLGGQLYGSNNNAIGKKATLDVFESISEIVKRFVVSQDTKKILIVNASNRKGCTAG